MNDHVEKRAYDQVQLANFKRLFQQAKNSSGVQAAFLIVEDQGDGKFNCIQGGDAKPLNMLRMFIGESNAYRRLTIAKLRSNLRYYTKRWLARMVGITLTEPGGYQPVPKARIENPAPPPKSP